MFFFSEQTPEASKNKMVKKGKTLQVVDGLSTAGMTKDQVKAAAEQCQRRYHQPSYGRLWHNLILMQFDLMSFLILVRNFRKERLTRLRFKFVRVCVHVFQLEEDIFRLREDLVRVCEEKTFFQQERDKIQEFCEISTRSLEEAKHELRNQQKEREDEQERQRVEITVRKH